MVSMTTTSNSLDPHTWVKVYADELYNYAMYKTGDSKLAEDLVQETFLAGLKSLIHFQSKSSERTWLFNILKFKIADYYRKASTKFEVSNSDFTTELSDAFLNDYFEPDGNWMKGAVPNNWANSNHKAIENKELGIALNNCIEKLPQNQKHLILLKLVEEISTEKICKELNIAPTNYWVMIHRAKLQLRACLEKNWLTT